MCDSALYVKQLVLAKPLFSILYIILKLIVIKLLVCISVYVSVCVYVFIYLKAYIYMCVHMCTHMCNYKFVAYGSQRRCPVFSSIHFHFIHGCRGSCCSWSLWNPAMLTRQLNSRIQSVPPNCCNSIYLPCLPNFLVGSVDPTSDSPVCK